MLTGLIALMIALSLGHPPETNLGDVQMSRTLAAKALRDGGVLPARPFLAWDEPQTNPIILTLPVDTVRRLHEGRSTFADRYALSLALSARFADRGYCVPPGGEGLYGRWSVNCNGVPR